MTILGSIGSIGRVSRAYLFSDFPFLVVGLCDELGEEVGVDCAHGYCDGLTYVIPVDHGGHLHVDMMVAPDPKWMLPVARV